MTDRDRQGDGRHGRAGGIVGAVVLIAVGLILLLRGMGVALPGNWWAVFLLIPAGFSLYAAWQSYRAHGGLTVAGVGPLVGGVILLTLAVMFLFNIAVNWDILIPVILIALGLAALARSYWRS